MTEARITSWKIVGDIYIDDDNDVTSEVEVKYEVGSDSETARLFCYLDSDEENEFQIYSSDQSAVQRILELGLEEKIEGLISHLLFERVMRIKSWDIVGDIYIDDDNDVIAEVEVEYEAGSGSETARLFCYLDSKDDNEFKIFSLDKSFSRKIQENGLVDSLSDGIKPHLLAYYPDPDIDMKKLIEAVSIERDRSEDSIFGLSASRSVGRDGSQAWAVSFSENYNMTIIMSGDEEIQELEKMTDEEIADLIAGCWQSEWDDIEATGGGNKRRSVWEIREEIESDY